ncbi:MAG: hypothetical protein PHH13_02715, partial [Candidatus Peribacteraceae bacterium]|nr:hypothetical protein [Candidatus Peribacteraceae bacterium]
IAFAVPGTVACNSTIQNTATVSASTTDPNSANNTSQTVSTTVLCPLPQADLSVSKTQIAPSVVMPGSVIVYRLTAINSGPDTATNVVVADVIPTGLTFNDSQSDDACVVNGNSVLCNNFSLTNGQSRSFIVAFNVPSTATCGSSVVNTATVSTSAVDPNSANNTSQTVTTGVQCPFADLSIVKSGVATINRGSTLLYTITVTNLGIAQANNVVVTDRPNPMTGLVFDSQQSDSNCVLNGIEVLCNNVNLAGGASRTYTIAFTVSSAVTCNSTILNTATVSTSTPDSNEQNNTSQTVSTTVLCPLPQADLSVSKTQIAPSVVMPGSVIVYRLTAINSGPDTATNVVVADVIPTGLTFNDSQSDDACVVNGNSVLCNNFSLTNGQSRSFIVAFNVPSTATCGSSVVNTATVSTSAVDPNSANNTSQTVTTGVQCPFADLSIVKSGVATINRGSTLLYTITVTNLGIAQANNVVVTDRPNPMTGLVFDSQQSDSNCVLNGIEVLCNNVNLAGGASRTYTIAFTVSSAVTCNSTILNTATVSTSTPDSNEQNNTSQTVSTTVLCPLPQADLSITKTGPQTVQRGSTVFYTLTATNAGPDTATNVVVADVIPTGLTFNDSQSDDACVVNGNSVLCNNFSLTSGQSKSFVIGFYVPSTQVCGYSISNTATVSSSSTDPNSSNNTSQTIATSVTCAPPTFTISKTDNAVTVQPNQNLTYQITVTNTSQTPATNVTVVDTLPALETFVSASDGGANVGGIVTWTGLSIAAGASKTLMLYVQVSASAPNGAPLINTASIDSLNASDTTIVQSPIPQADLSITKTAPVTANKGETILYTLTVTNAGPNTANNIVAADVIPAGLTFNAGLSTAGCVLNGAGTSVLCNNTNLTSGSAKTFILAFTVNNTAVCGGTIQNTATVSTSSIDPNSANNTSQTVSTTVQCSVPQADIGIVKTAPATVVPGQPILYTFTIHNYGPDAAPLVHTLDPIPAGLAFDSAHSDPACHFIPTFIAPSLVGCDVGTMQSGQTKTVLVSFNTLPSLACDSSITNTATVLSGNDPNAANNVSTKVVTVQCQEPQTDLAIAKTGPVTIQKGGTVTYSINVTNLGQNPAQTVVAEDVIPAGLTFLQAGSTQGCTKEGNSVLCAIGTLAAGQTYPIAIVFSVNDTAVCGGTILNTATVATSSLDPNSLNNTSQTISSSVQCPTPSFAISKTDNRVTAAPGDTLDYVITVTNTSQIPATNVTVTDTLPAQALIQHVSDGGTVSSGVVTWTGLSIAAGASKTLTIQMQVLSTASNGTVITNTASVAGLTAQDVTTIQYTPTGADVLITKAGPPTVQGGSIVLYTLMAFNLGPATAQNVVMRDAIPYGLTFNAANSDAICAQSGTTVLCTVGTLTSGDSRVATVAFNVPLIPFLPCTGSSCPVPMPPYCGTTIQNQATVISTNDPNAANNTSQTVVTHVQCQNPTFTITKSDGKTTAQQGEILTYTITVTNTSQIAATNATVTDTLPAHVLFLSASDGGSHSSGVVTWTGLSIAAGASKTLTLTAQVNVTAPNGTILTNTAAIAAASGQDTTVVQSITPTFTITKTDGRTTAAPGETLPYTITVTNTSQATASNVSITDTLP